MRMYVLSDLHLEFSDFAVPSLDVDLVVLAGDIHTLTRGVEWANDTFACDVCYVLGNHEFYRGHLDRTLEKAKSKAAAHVHLLENETFIFQNIRFLGMTAWTDFSSTGDISAAMSIARNEMTDFRLIRTDSHYRRIRPDDIAQRNRRSKEWLAAELEKPFPGRSVVITHHAPIIEVGGREHAGHLTAAYCNAWHSLVMQADGWVFGHTHSAIDTHLGGCHLISNPRGYPGEDTGFDAHKLVEF
ncbi:metallophosphoesterase [Pseudomonas coleopterorum]|uniref:metallophosphoesterase n=1 Tax=Pseudomonas coleopterorum TaxID=1605838 RepID=UPI002A6A9A55|nr:metallophosphoesterase [Pseudomonas coleopterorum]MDY1046970.1 metallophosphoesterase [Pseudomonas coleopterorum]